MTLKVLVLIIVIGLSAQAYAQQSEIAGGYNFQNSDQSAGLRINLNGWYVSVQYDFNPTLSVSIEADNYYGAIRGSKTAQQNFVVGPQVTFRPEKARIRPFGYLQAGDQRAVSGSVDHSFDLQVGGGAQVKLADRWALQITPFEYNLSTSAGRITNSYTVKVGVSWTFWSRPSG